MSLIANQGTNHVSQKTYKTTTLTPQQMNNLTLAGSGNPVSHPSSWQSSITNLNSIFVNFDNNNGPHIKKYEVMESTEDLLVLASTAHRIKSHTHCRLTSEEILKFITNEDREKAEEIRKYYSQKIMMLKLKEARFSSFREQLNKLVHSDGKMFREDMLGVAYHLPKFYEYDTQMDEIKIQVTQDQSFDKLDKDGKPKSLGLTCNLTPIKRLHRKTKHRNTYEYWFKDDNLNAGVVLYTTPDNQLLPLWEHFFDKKEVLRIKGNYIRQKIDGFEHFKLHNWKLENI